MLEKSVTQMTVRTGYDQFMRVDQLEELCNAMKSILGDDCIFSVDARDGYNRSGMSFENSKWKFDKMEEEQQRIDAQKASAK